MKFTKWVGQTDKKENWYEFAKRMRANEEAKECMQMYLDAFKTPLPYQDLIIVSQPKPSPTTFYPPIEEKEK